MRSGRRAAVMVIAGLVVAAWLGWPHTDDRPASPKPQIDRAVGPSPTASVARAASVPQPEPVALPTFTSTNARPLDLEGRTVAGFLDRMAPLARRGDAQVAYRVYQAEAMCGAIDGERRWIRETTAFDVEAMESLKRHVDRLSAACVGVTPAQMQERFGFLDQAIRAGNHDAMLDYRIEGPSGLDIETLDPNDPRLVDWKRRSNAYLELLAGQGEREAWMRLADDYRGGDMVPEDFASSIKYRTALVTSSGRPDRDPRTLASVAEMARTMATADVEEAIEQGRSLGQRFPSARP